MARAEPGADLAGIFAVVSRYGFVVDDGDVSLLADVFTADALFDLTALGGEVFEGLPEIRQFFALGSPPHPPAHHTTNVWITGPLADGAVEVRSKWLSIDRESGGMKSGEYLDEFVSADGEWRIRRRTVTPRWFPGEPVRVRD